MGSAQVSNFLVGSTRSMVASIFRTGQFLVTSQIGCRMMEQSIALYQGKPEVGVEAFIKQ